jgi:hypothetical protein
MFPLHLNPASHFHKVWPLQASDSTGNITQKRQAAVSLREVSAAL